MSPSREDILRELAGVTSALADLERTRDQLEARTAALRTELAAASPTTSSGPQSLPVARTPQTPTEKLKLFQSLFRGRPDVFPVRFVSRKTGRAGYAPACSNKWLPELCHLKSGGKCSDCSNQSFTPVSDQPILDHLQGRHVMGVYPLLEDETCWFLAVDFDERTWQQDVMAFARHVGPRNYPSQSSVPGRETARMPGSSSRRRSPRISPGAWVAICSRKP